MSSPTTPDAPAGPSPALEWLAANLRPVAYGLIAAGVVLVALAFVLGLNYKESFAVPVTVAAPAETEDEAPPPPTSAKSYAPTVVVATWVGILGGILLACGALPLVVGPGPLQRREGLRWQLLAGGAALGIVSVLAGLYLITAWWGDLTIWVRLGSRDKAWRFLLALFALLAGLAVMFLSLQAVRSEERSNANLRRVLYGYNSFLTGFLLLLILIFLNVGTALAWQAEADDGGSGGDIDISTTGIYSLSDSTRNVLQSLEQPAKVYVIMSPNSPLFREVTSVLDNCQRESRGNLRVETLSPETNLETIRKLIDSHKQEFSMIRGGGLVMGLLVTYGEKEQQAAYIRYTDLESFESDPQTGRTTGRSFLGEVKLVEQLLNLSEAGNRPVVYLLQGHEELELTDSAPASERGAGLFQQRLARRGNLTVKPLTFPQSNAKVPDDASVLVILAPKVPLLQDHVRAVGQYLNERQGKVLVLFDVRPAPGGTGMAMTGLEDLLRTYNVDVTNERILTMTEVVPGIGAMYPPESELSLAVIDSAMRSSLNPLAGLVRQARLIKVANCRVVRGTAFRSNLKAEQLLATPANLPCWTDTTPGVDTHRADAAMHGDEKYFTEHAKASLPMAVLVSEASEPVSPMQPPVAGKPRLAVFGSTTFAVNPAMNPAAPSIYYDLMVGSIDWLREKPAGIGVQAKTNRAFVLNPATTDWKALYLLPLGVMLLGVIGLGGGVWVARRR